MLALWHGFTNFYMKRCHLATTMRAPYIVYWHCEERCTAYVRAPERLLGAKESTNAIDLWAVGVVGLCLLTKGVSWILLRRDLAIVLEIACLFEHIAENNSEGLTLAPQWPAFLNKVGKRKVYVVGSSVTPLHRLVSSWYPVSVPPRDEHDVGLQFVDK